MSDLISIIIPVYNVEKYLETCLNSVINQTYSNIEIIIINDGSTDSSKEICNKFKKKDNRIKFIDKKNEGVSIARNFGLKEAHGKYIMFVDSDDFIENDMTEIMHKEIIKQEANIVICGTNDIDESGNLLNHYEQNEKLIMNGKEALKNMLDEKIYNGVCWGKLFEKDILINKTFNYKTKISEDLEFLYKIFYNSNKIVFIPNKKYNWLYRKDSVTHGKFNFLWDDEIRVCEDIIQFTKEKCNEISDYAVKRYLRINISCIKKIMREKENSEVEKKYINNLDKYEINNKNILPIKMRLNIFFIKHLKILLKTYIKCKYK